MARIAFDIDDDIKRQLKGRLALEGQTLSSVMRSFCMHYKDFGLRPGSQVVWEDRNQLPKEPGIYFIYTNGELQYVGRSKSLYSRLFSSSHHHNQEFSNSKTVIAWIVVPLEILNRLEQDLIATLEPPLNKVGKPNYNEITMSSFRCPIELERQIRIEAAKRDMNRTEFIIVALQEKLERIEAASE